MSKFPQSNLEVANNLNVLALSEYMHLGQPGAPAATPERFLELAVEMAGHEHPLVRYAAGWSATEAGLIEQQPATKNSWTLANREEALNLGNQIWHGIADAEWSEAARNPNPNLQADLWTLNMRQRIAMAYLPALQLVARARAEQPHPVPNTHERFRRVRVGLLPLVRSLMNEPDNASSHSMAAKDLAHELAVGWLLQPELLEPTPPREQRVAKPPHVVTPASLRENSGRASADSVDLNVYTLSKKSKVVPVQVSNETREARSGIFQVATLQYGETATSPQTLLRQIYRSETTDQRGNPHLAEVSLNLHASLAAHRSKR